MDAKSIKSPPNVLLIILYLFAEKENAINNRIVPKDTSDFHLQWISGRVSVWEVRILSEAAQKTNQDSLCLVVTVGDGP